MKLNKIHPFVWEAEGVDLGRAGPDLIVEVTRMLHQDGVVVFRDQDLDDGQQIAFVGRFGLFSGHNPEDREGYRDGAGPRLQRLTNEAGVGAASELPFHSDNTYAEHSIRYLALYGLNVTTGGRPLQGGETLLASAARAVGRLPPALRGELEGRTCRMGALNRGAFVRPCIERHWATGEPYIVPSDMTTEILGLDASRYAEVWAKLRSILYDPAFMYRHVWREGDLLFWDNRLMHHARAHYDNHQNRVLRRCAIADDQEPTAISL